MKIEKYIFHQEGKNNFSHLCPEVIFLQIYTTLTPYTTFIKSCCQPFITKNITKILSLYTL